MTRRASLSWRSVISVCTVSSGISFGFIGVETQDKRLGGAKTDFFETVRAMTHDGGVIGQAPEFMWFDSVFLDPLIAVGCVVEMDRARRSLDVVLAERVCTPKSIGFRGGAIHHEILQIEGEDLCLFLRLRRNQ